MKLRESEYIARFIYTSMIGDIIGYRNGEWEFNGKGADGLYYQVGSEYTNEIVFQFLALGGINNIDIKYWDFSDDSIMMLNTAKILTDKYKSEKDFGDKLSSEFVKNLNEIKRYHGGIRTVQSLEIIKNGTSWDHIPYDPHAKGSGTAMRTSIIGVFKHGLKNRESLIKLTIIACKMTHYSVVGVYSGLMVALFSAYAIEDIPFYQWLDKCIEDFGKYEKLIKSVFVGKDYELEEQLFFGKFKKYLHWRFSHTRSIDGINHLMDKIMINPAVRIKYLTDNFLESKPDYFFPGGRGDDAVILAYDALIQCQGYWEKLVINGMLHTGDSDTVGIIAAGWYALVYSGQIPEYNNDKLDGIKNVVQELDLKLN